MYEKSAAAIDRARRRALEINAAGDKIDSVCILDLERGQEVVDRIYFWVSKLQVFVQRYEKSFDMGKNEQLTEEDVVQATAILNDVNKLAASQSNGKLPNAIARQLNIAAGDPMVDFSMLVQQFRSTELRNEEIDKEFIIQAFYDNTSNICRAFTVLLNSADAIIRRLGVQAFQRVTGLDHDLLQIDESLSERLHGGTLCDIDSEPLLLMRSDIRRLRASWQQIKPADVRHTLNESGGASSYLGLLREFQAKMEAARDIITSSSPVVLARSQG